MQKAESEGIWLDGKPESRTWHPWNIEPDDFIPNLVNCMSGTKSNVQYVEGISNLLKPVGVQVA